MSTGKYEELSREELIEKIQELEESNVVFFEPQREIIVSNPSDEVLSQLSKISHLESTSGEHYKFEVREMDIWNSELSIEEIKERYTELLGSHPRFLEWADRIHQRSQIFSIEHDGTYHSLKSTDPERMEWARGLDKIREALSVDLSDTKSRIAMGSKSRAEIKKVLMKKGYPVQDNSKFREVDKNIGCDLKIDLRDYQEEYVARAYDERSAVLANPAGSGKTVTSIGLMAKVDGPTLVLVPQRSLVDQWKREILDKTTITEDQIGEYHGDTKEMNDITIATYHIAGEKTSLFRNDWGLIIFDECLTGDTVIETKKGRRTFEELEEELDLDEGWNRDVDLEVKSFDGGYSWDNVNGIYMTEAPVQRIETNTGKVLRATSGHTHVVFDPESFEIKDRKFVEEGDFLLQPLISPEIEDIEDKPKYELMGWFIGDGHLNEHGNGKFSFNKNAEEQVKIITELLESLGEDYTTFENSRGDLTVYSPNLEDLIEWEGIKGDKTEDIRVPADVYREDSSEISSLLRGLFDAEGSVDKKGRIQINTVSKKLADDIDLLLQKLGMMTRRQKIERDEHNDVNRLIVPTYYNDLFEERIGFRMEHKSQRVEEGVEPATGLPASNFLRKVKEDLQLYQEDLAEIMGISPSTVHGALNGDHRIGQSKLQRLAQGLREYSMERIEPFEKREEFNITMEEVADMKDCSPATVHRHIQNEVPETLELIEAVIRQRQERAEEYAERIEKLQDINLLEITEIGEVGEEKVYDLETESHRFIADGLLTHNCHHIPSQLFRKTASLQSTRRIGLSASPVREDSKEREIFALIGKEIGGDWARFFAQDYVRKPDVEIQFAEWASDHYRHKYDQASGIKKAIIASKNPAKKQFLEDLLKKHEDNKKVIFCDWIDQGEDLSQQFDIPFVSGETDYEDRERYFDEFRKGKRDELIVSRIGDEGLDLPDAEVGIIMSGQGSSRRQATQRAGRVMRPFGDAQVYIIATKGSNEEDFAKSQIEHLKEKGVPVAVKD